MASERERILVEALEKIEEHGREESTWSSWTAREALRAYREQPPPRTVPVEVVRAIVEAQDRPDNPSYWTRIAIDAARPYLTEKEEAK